MIHVLDDAPSDIRFMCQTMCYGISGSGHSRRLAALRARLENEDDTKASAWKPGVWRGLRVRRARAPRVPLESAVSLSEVTHLCAVPYF